jgi:hypothetical protein
MIFSVLPPALSNPLIDNKLDNLEGVISRTRYVSLSGDIKAINGQEVDDQNSAERRAELLEQMEEAGRAQDFQRMGQIGEELNTLPDFNLSLSMRDTTGTNFGAETVSQGRGLTPEDRGKKVGVLTLSDDLPAEITVGTILTIEVNRERYDFEVVGLQQSVQSGGFRMGFTFGDMVIPPGSIPADGESNFQMALADVKPESLDNVLLELSALPLVFSIDITFIDGLLSRFINQFSALPILVGLLSLGAAAVIMANTVALATLERRRQIGILKAVGLKGRRVLWVMLLENTLVSLLGGVLGVGLSALGVAFMSYLGFQDLTIVVPADSRPIAIALIVVAVLIGAVATFLSAQVAISERALNVLRYE